MDVRNLLHKPWDLSSDDPQALAPAGRDGTNHSLAVLVPYRDREAHLKHLMEVVPAFLDAQNVRYSIFVLEQVDDYMFNRGALLNAAANILAASDYDYYVFQDVDTLPKIGSGITYDFPEGHPIHLTPYWIHPKATYKEFFGGLLIITREQYFAVNGYGTDFWGWGREDDNLRDRLTIAGMWPCVTPNVTRTRRRDVYFEHQRHRQATELRGQEREDGSVEYFEEDPGRPYDGARIMSSQPDLLQDRTTGISTVRFRVQSVQPYMGATKLSIRLHCNKERTPWCDPTSTVKKRTHAKKTKKAKDAEEQQKAADASEIEAAKLSAEFDDLEKTRLERANQLLQGQKH